MEHPQAVTNRPIIYDSEALNERIKIMDLARIENKLIEREFKAVQAGILDGYMKDMNARFELGKYFTSTDEYIHFYNIYLKAQELFIACTDKQQLVLYLLVCKKKKLCECAKELDISSPGVLKHLQLIQKRALKLKINLNGDEQK